MAVKTSCQIKTDKIDDDDNDHNLHDTILCNTYWDYLYQPQKPRRWPKYDC